MRQIAASEVKPGMTIRWGRWDISYQCTLTRVEPFNGGPGVQGETRQGKTVFLRGDDDVLVVKEPAQPEEPTEFGARVTAGNLRFLRSYGTEWPWVDHRHGELYAWEEVCSYGLVTVIPDNGWTVPEPAPVEAPVVPERIEEWPEGEDEHLRGHRWKDSIGTIWSFRDGQWGYQSSLVGWLAAVRRPLDGPWTRVTDA